MEDTNKLIQDRINKLNALREAGVNPYPYSYNKTHHANDINEKYGNLKPEEETKDTVKVAGRIMQLRCMGKITFIHLMDETGKVQIYLRKDDLKDKYKLVKKLDIGDFIGAEGHIFKTKMGEVTVYVKDFDILTKSLRPLPEKYHGLKDEEIRYRKRYLDLIMNPEVKDTFLKRAKIYKAIREFMDDKGFIEVQIPIIQTQYGGANARPFATKINAWNMPMYLRIAYELHLKRLMVGGFEKVYALCSCFRNEGVDKTHNPEFAMMEIQWAYQDYNAAMQLTEELWEYVVKKVSGTTKIEFEGKKIDLKAPWKRMTVKEALKEYAEMDVDKLSDEELKDAMLGYNIEYEGDFSRGTAISLLFEYLCEDKLINPVHIIDHPQESCPLAKLHRDDPALIERVEPYINGWEVGNCYSELIDPIRQRVLLEDQAAKGRGGDEEAHPMDEDYVEALEHGLPPNTGIGIGIDRMIMLLTGASSIRDVILFPTMKPLDEQKKPSK